ncbi:hypothetical protein [Legionella drozanskii]|uniref:hypothetical protein n=1 Tax=Legionella drozanskii TaxID=96228 RepID=UPI000B3089ED|nr:hypothetical protein [Legionella drozanskii]
MITWVEYKQFWLHKSKEMQDIESTIAIEIKPSFSPHKYSFSTILKMQLFYQGSHHA